MSSFKSNENIHKKEDWSNKHCKHTLSTEIKFYGMHTIAELLLSYNVMLKSFNVFYTQK